MTTYDAETFALGDDVRICVYRPKTDLHFPLATSGACPWRMLAWAIVRMEGDDIPNYVAILSPRSKEPLKTSYPQEVKLESQFGPITIILRELHPFEAADSRIRASVCGAILRSVAGEPKDMMIDLLEQIELEIKGREVDEDIAQAHMPPSSRREFTVEGIRTARYVITLDTKPMIISAVNEIRFDCGLLENTVFKLSEEVTRGRILLIADKQYQFAAIK